MINLVISIVAGLAIALATGFLLGGGELRLAWGIVPGLITMLAIYIVMARRSMKQVQTIVTRAQAELQSQNIDRGIEVLKSAYPIGKWQFMVTPQIDSQIGSVLYMTQRFDESEAYLKRSFKKNWVSRAMLATLYYKRKKYDEMTKVFEEAVLANKKESLLWNVYAYCTWKSGDKDKAITILNRALKPLPEDEKTKNNLKALQNNKKMKMRSWNMMWYQFHLDKPPVPRQQVQFRRR
jgi:tetratricopeptide (TPR) repeat protein